MMKLSEAILLGSTVLTPKAGQQHYSELNAGCALGMAAVAAGYTFRPATEPFDEKDRRTLGTEGVWGSWVLTVVRRPCDCWRLRVPREMRAKDVIAHLFDRHVMVQKDWTIEQLAAWVETVEPRTKAPKHSENEMPPAGIPFYRSQFNQRQFLPSQEEIDNWQEVREALEQRSGAARKHSRIRG
jgi:hypothetical protein